MRDLEVYDKIRRLILQLVSGTENGKIAWTDTGDAEAFRAQMQGGMVRVQKRVRLGDEGHEAVEYSLTLLDRKGRELEDYYPEPLSPECDLANLWNLARRSSRGSVEVLDMLLKEITSENR